MIAPPPTRQPWVCYSVPVSLVLALVLSVPALLLIQGHGARPALLLAEDPLVYGDPLGQEDTLTYQEKIFSAKESLARLRREPFALATEQRLANHTYVLAAEACTLTLAQRRAFAGEQYAVQLSDARSFAVLAGHVAFQPASLAGVQPPPPIAADSGADSGTGLFQLLLEGELYAAPLLLRHAAALGSATCQEEAATTSLPDPPSRSACLAGCLAGWLPGCLASCGLGRRYTAPALAVAGRFAHRRRLSRLVWLLSRRLRARRGARLLPSHRRRASLPVLLGAPGALGPARGRRRRVRDQLPGVGQDVWTCARGASVRLLRQRLLRRTQLPRVLRRAARRARRHGRRGHRAGARRLR